MAEDCVLLRNGGDIVGFGKYVLDVITGGPREVIHGHELQQFAKAGEHLVAIHSVQIFEEFELQSYPYKYKGFEDPPALLGDLNKLEKSFKATIAWDNRKLVKNPIPSTSRIGALPQRVSAHVMNSIRDLITPSPKIVRFKRTSDSAFSESQSEYPSRSLFPRIKDANGSGSSRSFDEPLPSEYEEDSDIGVSSRSVFEESQDVDSEINMEIVNNNADISLIEEPRVPSIDFVGDVLHGDPTLLKSGSSSGKKSGCDTVVTDKEAPKDPGILSQPYLSPGERILSMRKRAERNRKRSEGYLSPAERIQKSLRENPRISRKCGTNLGDRIRWNARNSNCETQPMTGPSFLYANGELTNSQDSYTSGGYSSGHRGGEYKPSTSSHLNTSRYRPVNRAAAMFGRSAAGAVTGVTNGGEQESVVASINRLKEAPPFPRENELAATARRKRIYRNMSRKKASPKKESSLRQKRMRLWQKSFQENPFSAPRGCCNAGCFLLTNPEYAVVQYRKFLLMDREDRKRVLKSMYIPAVNAFWFDGGYVCSRFLSNGLSFSNQLQCAVKGTPRARASASIHACPRDNSQETKRNQIIVYLKELSERIGDKLPTKPHTNLPLMCKKQVMERFQKHNRDMVFRADPSISYFYHVWKKFCADIKTHRHHGFTVCDTCEKIRMGFESTESERVEGILRREMEVHYKFVDSERRGYERRRDLASSSPNRYLSIIVDGADQKSYGLPHFVFSTKQDRGQKLKMKVVGVLEHGSEKQLSLFTLTEDFESGANHVIEAIHRVLNKAKEKRRRLPPVLFIQADNCTRENKNRFLLSYLELLVKKGVFKEVHISFLPIGHTHADIDQAFSAVAVRFKLEPAATDYDMLNLLRKSYNPCAFAEPMDEIVNFSGLCETTDCIRKIEGFSKYRFFRFMGKKAVGSSNDQDQTFATTCDVKYQETEEWSPLDNSIRRDGFLKFVPDLKDTPDTDTTPPDNVLEINKHLRASEHRIASVASLQRLEELRDIIYTRRKLPFHWNLDNTFEENGACNAEDSEKADCLQLDPEGVVEPHEEFYVEKFNYSLNYFLAVKTAEGCRDPFWIARTLQIDDFDEDGTPVKLKVRWYQAKDACDAFSSAYVMSTYVRDGGTVLFDDTVDVRTILCEFESLTRRGCLPVNTQKVIRNTLNLH